MRLDYLIERLLDSIAQERTLLRRVTRYILPLLLLPLGFALAQIVHGWLGVIAGGICAAVLLAQIELFLRPTFDRVRVTDGDITFYFGRRSAGDPPDRAPAVPLLIPSALALGASMLLFLPPLLANASPWQRLLALAVGLGALWMIWQRLSQVVVLLDRVEAHLSIARSQLSVVRRPEDTRPRTENQPKDTRPRTENRRTKNKEQRTTDYGLRTTDYGPRTRMGCWIHC
jgi:hypothetical protein